MPSEDTQFGAGRSGNPGGRPKGARNRTTQAVEALLDGEAEALTRKAIELALDGDGPALRLCLDRLCPPRKDRTITFDMPEIENPADFTKATRALMQGVANGEITPTEASELSKLVDVHVKAIVAGDFVERFIALEKAVANKGGLR
ncbi:hypothetical protein SAMN05216360_12913 [Methylobacterium phyllostachyos]|uniref:DUF5681 domain-containing protein n=1 Tax=Methylobacterium phyllostachyos TaxID=582672 RepID=A0A1H0KTS2_9HYPH|nr:DUF5681 domain-containing protein [Methylobacterium phyllostachyos]SDO59367.1 hypothetical protein SAMN05216360_12913 [Methylobacterium phyllostachyos]